VDDGGEGRVMTRRDLLAALIPLGMTARHHRRRHRVPPNPGGGFTHPLHAATQADKIVAKFGVSGVGGGAAYDNTTFTVAKLTELGARYARLGRVSVGDTTQRAIAVGCGNAGITVIGLADDYGTQTPNSRLVEMRDQWGSGTKIAEGLNEPQGNVAQVVDWLYDYATDSPTGTTEPFGVNEARRQQQLLWTERGNLGLNWSVIHSGMAVKSKFGSTVTTSWYHRLGDVGSWCTHGNLHRYQGGDPPLDNGDIAAYLTEMEASAPGKPKVITETGYHNDPANIGIPHIYTSENAAGRYVSRMFFEFYDLFAFWCLYELFDEDAYRTGIEGHFGQYKNVNPAGGGSATAKAAGLCASRITGLIADPGVDFTPAGLRYSISGQPTDYRDMLLEKRNGRRYLVAWRDVSVFNKTAGTDTTVSPVTVTYTLENSATINVFDPFVQAAAISSTAGTSFNLALAGNVLIAEII